MQQATNTRTGSSTIAELINERYMHGVADSVGTVEYGPGHYIFEQVAGGWYSLRTDSDGFTYLDSYPTATHWAAAQLAVENAYGDDDYQL